jgi:HK97 family phage portal protein
MSIFTRIFRRDNEPIVPDIDPALLQALLGNDEITKEIAMSIPAVAACVNRIAETIASLEVKLFEKNGEDITEIEDDPRTKLLNGETGDTLTGYQLKEAMVRDMLLGKGGYCFIRRVRGNVRSLNYVPCEYITIFKNNDIIFKEYQLEVQGKRYEGHQFVKLLRNSQNGWSGKSIIADSNILFQIVAAEQDYEKHNAATGGARKGFFKAQNTLTDDAMKKFRAAYKNLYVNGSESSMILNNGMDFKEISASAAELQLNENKTTNNNDICKIFGIPPSIINGNATKEDRRAFYEGCIYPILTNFAKSLNDVLLNPYLGENEMFFAFDDSGLTKADIDERYSAYEKGIKNGFLQLDEVRKRENMPALGVDFVKLGLQDVLFYPESGDIYTPNMGVMANVHETEPNNKEVESDDGSQSKG